MPPNQSIQPESSPQPIMPTPSKMSWRKKGALIGAAVLGIGLLMVAVFSFMPASQEKKNGLDPDAYYDRKGYDRSTLSTAVGDPAALVATAGTGAAATYQNTTVIEPCNILTPANIQAAGLQLKPGVTAGVIEREIIDGQGQAALKEHSFSLDILGGNRCSYSLVEDGSVRINMYQEPYSTTSALRSTLARRYTKQASIGQVEVYQNEQSEASYSYILRTANAAAALSITLNVSSEDEIQKKLLEQAAQNLAAQTTAPTGPLTYTYESPLLQKREVLQACALYTAQDVQQVFGTSSAHPFVTERIATAVGTLNMADNSEELYNYVNNQCVRQTNYQAPTQTQSVRISTQTFATEAPAKAEMRTHANLTPVSAVSSEAYFGNTSGTQNALVFRKGTTVITIGYYDGISAQKASPEQMIERLTPLAKKIAEGR